MAQIDSSFPFNRLGLPRFGEPNGNEDTGVASRLRRAQEERPLRADETRGNVPPADRVSAVPRPQEGDALRPVEDVVRRQAETTPPPPDRQPATGNVEQLTANRAPLRSNFLETTPSLRANRELRNLLAQTENANDVQATVERPGNNLLRNNPEPFVLPQAQADAGPPPVTEARATDRAEPDRTESAQETRRAQREEVDRQQESRPRPLTPEAQLTQRGLNINQFI